jgi:hypothetical protein
MDDCTAVVAISKLASDGACFVSMPFESIILLCIMIQFCLLGKRAALKKFMDSQTLSKLGDVFLKISQMEDILKSGERIITNLYRGVPS